MNRRTFLQSIPPALLLARSLRAQAYSPTDQPTLSITIDDPNINPSPLLTPTERRDKMLAALDKHGIKAALFVCGKRVDSEEGKALIAGWDNAGHLICNHSYSHNYYHAKSMTLEAFSADMLHGDEIIKGYVHYTKLFRFPYLKEGDTTEKRDGMRAFLASRGYANGSVSLDASDWAVDERLRAALAKDAKIDLRPYKEFYIKHLLDRAMFYDGLADKVVGRKVTHTMLLHHTLLNALFLGDVLDAFVARGWQLTSAETAFRDPMFKTLPNVLPAGESIVWSLAKESGKYDNILRYPGEDESYEKPEMDRLGL